MEAPSDVISTMWVMGFAAAASGQTMELEQVVWQFVSSTHHFTRWNCCLFM
jgi:hypothetical protein